MYLQYHPRAQSFGGEPLEYVYHCHLDDVGLRALDGRVDGVAFGEASHGGVARCYIGQIASAVVDGLGVALLAAGGDGLVHVCLDAWEGGEIVVDELASL